MNTTGTANGAQRVVLLGTVHGDLKGRDRLVSAFESLRPDAVTVEISPMSVVFRTHLGPRLLNKLKRNANALAREAADSRRVGSPDAVLSDPRVERVARKCSMPYEFAVAHEYGKRSGVRIVPVDLSEEAYGHLMALASELVSEDNLRMILDGGPEHPAPSVEDHWAIAREVAEGRRAPSWMDSSEDREEILRRDRHMAREIRRVVEGMKQGTLVHVGGYEHLAPVPGSLRTLLEPFHPSVELLCDLV